MCANGVRRTGVGITAYINKGARINKHVCLHIVENTDYPDARMEEAASSHVAGNFIGLGPWPSNSPDLDVIDHATRGTT